MSNVVYLMTSLPSLTYGQLVPISIDEFNSDAQSQLSARHYNKLESFDIQKMSTAKNGIESVRSLLHNIQSDLSEFRNARVQNRQARLDCVPKSVLAGNPLEREKQIMRWQWEELDSIEAGKTFTFTEVVVYKLKLQILCRLNSFDEKNGAQVLESVVNPSKREEGK